MSIMLLACNTAAVYVALLEITSRLSSGLFLLHQKSKHWLILSSGSRLIKTLLIDLVKLILLTGLRSKSRSNNIMYNGSAASGTSTIKLYIIL